MASDERGPRFADLPDLLTVEEMAVACRVGKNTAYEMTRRVGFPVIRLGRRKLIPKAALARWVETQAVTETADYAMVPINGLGRRGDRDGTKTGR